MSNIKIQIRKLYIISVLSNFSFAGASWVVILAARGFSLVEIGLAETIFHVTSLMFEIPSGMLADLYGRKKMVVISRLMAIIGCVISITSKNFADIALVMIFSALSYNFASGSGEALAYDSLKQEGREAEYEKYAAMQMTIYRVAGGGAQVCAGLALTVGYQVANAIEAAINFVAMLVAGSLMEAPVSEGNAEKRNSLWVRIKQSFMESASFLKNHRPAVKLMLVNSLIGAFAILLEFFLQARLQQVGVSNALLGPLLFFMGLGGVLGAKIVLRLKKWSYRKVALLCFFGVCLGVLADRSSNWILMSFGGFIATLSDDMIQIRTDALLNEMIPSDRRATLISVSSFCFSVIMIILSPLAGMFFAS